MEKNHIQFNADYVIVTKKARKSSFYYAPEMETDIN